MTKDFIKKEALKLIEKGYSNKDAINLLYQKYGSNTMNRRQFDNKYGRFVRRNNISANNEASVSNIVKFPTGKVITQKENGDVDISIKNLSSDKFPSKEEILKQAELDPNLFELGAIRKSTWNAQTPDGIEELVSIRVTAKPKEITIEDSLKHLQKALQKFPDIDLPAARLEKDGEEIAIVAIPDLHLGKFADSYDCSQGINQNTIIEAYRQIIADAKMAIEKFPVEKILFYWSNDFFHYDNKAKTTTKGTPQNTDLSASHMFDLGVELLIEGINELSKLAPVKTFYTMSNHDELTGSHAITTLKYAFRNNPNVEVDDSKFPRYYERYGVNLFGFAHGDKEGNRIKTLMQQEASEDWGKTIYREWLLGHFHSLKLSEEGGIVFKYMQSPTGPDDWHTTSGYVGAWQCGTLLIRSKTHGPVADMPLMVSSSRTKGREEVYKSQLSLKKAA